MRVIDIENITYNMRRQTQFVLRCEEVFHDKISAAAATILENKNTKPLVALTGPSGSGKTTTAMRLRSYLENLGVKVCLLSMDNFFLANEDRPAAAQGDWESPLCVNWDLLVSVLDGLQAGQEVDVPWFDFIHSRTGGWRKMQGDPEAVIIIEGIHMLNPIIFDRIGSKSNGIYVAPRTRILTTEDRIVRPEQVRVARRLIRDYNTRGHGLRDTVLRAESVNTGERNYIAPHKGNADIHIDTFHDYELCILARYLREIPQFAQELTPEFMAEHDLTDLLKVVNSIPPLHTPYVPQDSLIREFVGGSCFEY